MARKKANGETVSVGDWTCDAAAMPMSMRENLDFLVDQFDLGKFCGGGWDFESVLEFLVLRAACHGRGERIPPVVTM